MKYLAQTESDELSSIITSDDLDAFQASYSDCRGRDFPPIKTLTLFMRQVASDTKSCRHALIDEARYIGKEPREVSFKAAQDTLVSFLQVLLGATGDGLENKVINMLEIIGQYVVGNRPGRSEPRVVKKRPKPHKKLQYSRS